jgi:hypothetical protein
MKQSYKSVALCASLGIGLSLACAGNAGATTQQEESGQARIAGATAKLESVFADQFVRGQIDRAALTGPIDEVIQSMPEAARPRVAQHIDQVVDAAEKLAPQMTAEQRVSAAKAPSEDKIGHLEWGLVNAWGWPAGFGWGGLGAFGFPGMYGFGYPGLGGFYGTGFNTGYSCATGFGCYGLGFGGLYW